ncbi:MAG: hypothetical protein PHU63_02735 [Candidatus ainarchaeum sp.]|nr:hypothetical protein [Candidatus ainarchaeum sp.]
MELKKLGPYVFLGGFIIALLVGLAGQNLDPDTYALFLGILGVLGLVVGFVNITDKEVVAFLVAVIALLQVQTSLTVLTSLPVMVDVLPFVTAIVAALVIFLLPAAFVVALKTIYDLAGERAFETVEGKVFGKKRR